MRRNAKDLFLTARKCNVVHFVHGKGEQIFTEKRPEILKAERTEGKSNLPDGGRLTL